MFDDLRDVTVTGGITQDISLAYTNSGTAMLKLNIGSTERKKVGDDYENKSHYYEAVVWGKYAEMLSSKLSKGDKILVKGSLDFQSWEKDGQKRSKLVINANSVKPLGNKKDDNNSNQNNNQNNNYNQQNNQQQNNQQNSQGNNSYNNYPNN